MSDQAAHPAPLQTQNLNLTLGDGIADMRVTGKMKADTMSESFEWFDELTGAGAEFQLCVEMKAENFDDLSEAAAGFRQVGDVFRRTPDVARCAVLTDSDWLRNTAKVEGAVIPGLDLKVFAPEAREDATRWLKGEPLMQTEPKAEAEDAPKAEAKADEPANSGSAWDNLDLGKVS